MKKKTVGFYQWHPLKKKGRSEMGCNSIGCFQAISSNLQKSLIHSN